MRRGCVQVWLAALAQLACAPGHLRAAHTLKRRAESQALSPCTPSHLRAQHVLRRPALCSASQAGRP